MLIFLRVVGVRRVFSSLDREPDSRNSLVAFRGDPVRLERSRTRESNRGEKRRNESRLRMLSVYIYIYIYTGEIVRIDLEMRILRAECVLRGCSGGALVHTFPSSFSWISPGSGSTPFFTLPRLRFASQIYIRTGHFLENREMRSRISSLHRIVSIIFFYFIFLTDIERVRVV